MSNLEPADFFVLRTPVLPWDVLRGWSEGLAAGAAHATPGDLDAAVAHDERLLRARLREIVRRAEIREALYVASPSLYARLGPWLDGDDGDKARSVEPPVVRYLTRMAGRATPFGLFAGYSLGVAAERTELAVPPLATHTRCNRLSVDIVYALAMALARRPEHRAHIRYRSNTTAYRIGERLRYYAVDIDAASVSTIARHYSLCETAANVYTDAALAAGRDGADMPIDALGAAIVARFDGVDEADARRYVQGLVDAQLFWPSLLPPVTGADPTQHLIDELRRLPNGGADADRLAEAHADMIALDSSAIDIAARRERLERVVATIGALGGRVHPPTMVRVDLRKPAATATLNRAVLNEVASGLDLLASIAPDKESPMGAFARAFAERYQGREVLLLEALDPESGIGFETPPDSAKSTLLKGLEFEAPKADSVAWGRREALLLGRLAETLRAGATELRLSDGDIAALSSPVARRRPAGQTAVVSIAAASPAAIDRGDYQILFSLVGRTTSAALFGRFLNDDPELEARVRALLIREEAHDGDAIHAEVAHHLETIGSNLSRRPVLRDYEIDVIAASGAERARRIPLDDLLVSVRDAKVVLRSRALGRRVVPHLSNAHLYTQPGLALYRFLACLQAQEVNERATWAWGSALASAPFLPRVTYGRFVLALATWKLSPEVVAPLGRLRGATLFRAVQRLRAERGLPRQVSLVSGDNVLPVDLENILSIECMIGAAKGLDTIELSERFADGDALVAHGPEGAFCHELFVPVLRADTPAAPAPRVDSAAAPLEPTADRLELPGGAWLFAKLYCGVATSDRLLASVVAPLVAELRAAGLIDQWFFIRYADPGYHLRLRFHGDPATLWTDVASRLFTALSGSRAHWARIAIDCYDPEVERYGGDAAMAVVHRVFEADSDSALRFATQYRGNVNARWRAALLAMDALLDDLGLTLADRRAVVAGARDDWGRAVGAGASASRKLGESFRGMRLELEALLRSAPAELQPAVDATRARSPVVRRCAAALRELDARRALTAPLPEIAASLLHMSANRIFRGSANRYEFALYEFLHRIYDGALARERARASSGAAAAYGSAG